MDLFSGIGGIALGLQGIVMPVAYCEIEPYCQSILLQSMRKKLLPDAPVWTDVRTLPRHLGSNVDIITAGFPCQNISIAGDGSGLEGEQSGLFFDLLRWVDAIKCPWIFLENVPAIRTRGAERVCKELAKRGYDLRWTTNTAQEFGAPHKRERWWLLGYAERFRQPAWTCEELQSSSKKPVRPIVSNICSETPANPWQVESPICGISSGVSHRSHRIKALGNAVVPIQTREAFKKLMYG